MLFVIKSQPFKDIKLFNKDIDNHDSVKFFYNKFYLYFNFLWININIPLIQEIIIMITCHIQVKEIISLFEAFLSRITH